MKPRFLYAVALAGFLALAFATPPGARADDDQYSELHVQVVKDYNGKPIRNASVILHEVDKDGRQSRGGLELKTDLDGNAKYSGVRYGKLRVQVIVRGFQTFGEDFDINEPTQNIVIKMKRPQQQFSIYENPDEKKPDDKKQDEKKQDNKKPEDKKPQDKQPPQV